MGARAHAVSTGKSNAVDLRWSVYIDDILNFSELAEKLIDIDEISIDISTDIVDISIDI